MVFGKTISEKAIEAATNRMQSKPFKSKTIETELFYGDGNLGGFTDPQAIWMRAADRLIQKERKAGNIRFDKTTKMWHPVEKADAPC